MEKVVYSGFSPFLPGEQFPVARTFHRISGQANRTLAAGEEGIEGRPWKFWSKRHGRAAARNKKDM
jgi:hypothetical protein